MSFDFFFVIAVSAICKNVSVETGLEPKATE
jgi:hypothetical protein